MAGVITSIPPLVEQPPGSNSSNPAGLPGVTYTAAIPNLPQTWTALQTFNPNCIQFAGSTSGNTFLNATAIASGTLILPAVATSDTLLSNNNTATVTNKSIDGLQNTLTNIPASAFGSTTGTGPVVLQTGPTIINPSISGATITTSTYNGNTWTAGTGVLTLAAGKTVTISNTLTFSGTDGSTAAFGVGGTVAYKGLSLAQFASTTSLELKTLISDETGSGALVFANTPTLVTPVLGAATATTINGITISASTGSLTVNTNALALSGSGVALTLAGTGTTTQTFPTTSATLARTDAGQTFTGTQSFNGQIAGNSIITGSVNNAQALYITTNGGSNAIFQVDTSTASAVAGLKVTGAVTGGTVALAVIDSGANANLDIAAKGTGTINIAQNSSGAVNIGNASPTVNIGQSGAATLNVGKAGLASGTLVIAGSTSGAVTIIPTAIASGTLTLPNGADTLVGKATTDVLTNKTYDTAGTGNSFKINGTAITAVTGTGSAVLATSPTLVTPALGTPSALVLTNATGLPLSGHTAQAAFTFVGNNTSGSAAPTAVDIAGLTSKASPVATDLVMISDQAAAGAWKKVTISSLASAGSVASIAGNTGAFTLGVGLTNAVNDLRVSLTNVTNSLGADVALNNTGLYFDGPSVAQGTSGTWFVSGTVTITDPTNPSNIDCKLWDGTTVIASTEQRYVTALPGIAISLSGVITSPAANLRISCKSSNTTSFISFNKSGNSKDSTVTAVRIA